MYEQIEMNRLKFYSQIKRWFVTQYVKIVLHFYVYLRLFPPGGTNPKPEAPTTTPLVSEPGCVIGKRTGPMCLKMKSKKKIKHFFSIF